MERLTSIKSPEEFLIGKTVIASGKAHDYDGELISFIFSDNTYCILRVVDTMEHKGKRLIFSSSDAIIADVEEMAEYWHKQELEKAKNDFNARPDKTEEDVFEVEKVSERCRHPFQKLRYAETLLNLKLIPESIYEFYKKEAEITELIDSIKHYYAYTQPSIAEKQKRLAELTKNEIK